jgi:hypothetical protein
MTWKNGLEALDRVSNTKVFSLMSKMPVLQQTHEVNEEVDPIGENIWTVAELHT